MSFITHLIVRVKPKPKFAGIGENKLAETSMSGPEPVDLPGAIPTDSMIHQPEHNSLNLDDVNIISDVRIG